MGGRASVPGMPELPEVETVRRSLLPHLLGCRVGRVTARPVRLRQGIDPGAWSVFAGQTVTAVGRRGKYLLLHGTTHTALFHLGMSGRLLLQEEGADPLPHTHLVVRCSHGLALAFVDPRRFGSATVVTTAAWERLPCLARLGPDALAPEAADAIAGAGRSHAPIRNVLLDQRVVAGLGNIYATEALARAGIRPHRPAATVGRRRLAALAAAVRTVLEEAIAAGGTTLADGGFRNADGQTGYFAVDLKVYGRAGQPCLTCGATIRRLVVAGRSTFFCPSCQS